MISNVQKEQLEALRFYGVLAHLDDLPAGNWLPWLLSVENSERQKRSLERRIISAKLGRFKLMADFDWRWPDHLDRAQLDSLFALDFLSSGSNPIFVGPNGVGKTMLAKNLAYRALLGGHTVRFTTASVMLSELSAQDGASGLHRRLGLYVRPRVLVIDEIGYLSYGNRHADLLFEVITRRYNEGNKPIIVTTNKPFRDWSETFPNATCVVTLVDRLVHRSEIVQIKGQSFRLKEAKEAAAIKITKRQ
ncbi:MAG TPA: AAA family ATPase, partial [Flavobacteriales bacterium]|nr:AAA family ATPase [Flavobacteriales bacterium]